MLALASPASADGEPATRASSRVVDALEEIRVSLRETRYAHHRTVRRRRGQYFFDCSGMVQWVLGRAARRSQLDLREGQRPLAIHYVRRIERAPTDRLRGGWQRLETIDQVRPGDVFAWRRPPDFQSANTGHVGFVLETPVRWRDGFYLVRVADASRYTHQDDTRPWPGPGGFGHGTILVATEDGRPVGYGWRGVEGRAWRRADFVFGRVGP